jgi:hypothetical protein
MNPFVFEIRCDICGEEGVATPDTVADHWTGGRVRHTNPEVCARNLKRKKEELEEKEKKLDKNL